MATAKGAGAKALWRNIHLWIGLGLFVVLAPLGLSGSLLVWDDALGKAMHPARYAVTTGAQSPGAYLEAAQRAFAGRAVPAQLRLPQDPGVPVTVTGYRTGAAPTGQRPPQLTAWIDPGSARVLEVANPRQDALGVIHQLHGNLLLPQNGRAVVGWLGLFMLALSVTGLILWWPRGAKLRRGLRWTRSSWLSSNLHHMTGFWISLPLAILSISGAYIAWPQMVGASPQGQGGRPGGGFAAPLASRHTNLDQATAAAEQAVGDDARLVSATVPTAGGKPSWRLQLRAPGAEPVTVRVDDATGRARAQPGRATEGPGGGDPFAVFMRRLHDGSGYGPAWQWIITLAGAAPTLLGITGAIVWLKRRKISA